MKNVYQFLMMLALVLISLVSFISCDDDNDNNLSSDGNEYFIITINGETISDTAWGGEVFC